MNIFEFRLDWDQHQAKLDSSIEAFVGELGNLGQVNETVENAARNERLSKAVNLRNRKLIADLVRGEMRTNADRSPQEIFESVKSQLQSASDNQDKLFDAVGDIIESAASFVGKVGEADAGGVASDVYSIANGLRKAFKSDAKLGVEIADVLRIYYTAKVERSARGTLSAFNETTEKLMREAFAYRSHHKGICLEQGASSSAARYALQPHSTLVEMAAEKATNGIYEHFALSGNPLLPVAQMAAHKVTKIERSGADPFHFMQKAGWLANGHRSSVTPNEIISGFIEDAIKKGPAAAKEQLHRDVDVLHAALMDLQIPQMHAQMIESRYGPQGLQGGNATVLFEDHRFQSDLKQMIRANPDAIRSPPPPSEIIAKITHLQEELGLSSAVILRERLINPTLRQTCDEDLATIGEIGAMLKSAPEKVQHVGISWGRTPDRQYFGRLKEEVKESLEIALKVHAEQREERKTELQSNMQTLIRGEKPTANSTRRLDR
jgi:hypothetical protein